MGRGRWGLWWRQGIALVLVGGLLVVVLRALSAARIERADMVFNNSTEISTLDPATVTGVPEGRILRAIFEGLTIKDPETLDPLPGMAERWEISPDGLTYTFHIRRGAHWTNGDPVTAHDFVYSWQRFLDPRTAAEYAYQLWYVEGAEAYSTDVGPDGAPRRSFDTVGIRALDEQTLEVKLAAPTPFFLQLTAFYPLYPVNQRNLEEAKAQFPDTWQFEWLRPERLVTNGPFRVTERRVNDRIRLVKNEDYWAADEVALRTIDALAIESYMTGLNLYLSGEVDWINLVPASLVPRLLPREDFDPTPYFGSYFFRINTTRPHLADKRIRRALSLAIDRRAITDKIVKSGQRPWYSLVPFGMEGYTPQELDHAGRDGELAYAAALSKDQEEARRIFAELGYGSGGRDFPTVELHYNTSETHRDIAEVVADTWKRVLGVDAKLLNQEWKVYLDTQSNLNFDVSRSAWIGDYIDPNTFLDLFVTGGENNKTGWGNSKYDELIQKSKYEVDPAVRRAQLEEAERILMDELPILPIYSYVTQNIVNPRLGGFPGNLLDEQFPRFWYWMDDQELAERRAARGDDQEIATAPGPKEGLYSPAQMRRRAAGGRGE